MAIAALPFAAAFAGFGIGVGDPQYDSQRQSGPATMSALDEVSCAGEGWAAGAELG